MHLKKRQVHGLTQQKGGNDSDDSLEQNIRQIERDHQEYVRKSQNKSESKMNSLNSQKLQQSNSRSNKHGEPIRKSTDHNAESGRQSKVQRSGSHQDVTVGPADYTDHQFIIQNDIKPSNMRGSQKFQSSRDRDQSPREQSRSRD